MNSKIIVILMTIILSFGFINSNAFSYLFEDTIYIEISSITLSSQELNKIRKILELKFEKIDLSIDKSKKRATYKYRIDIDKNSINITNLKTNRKNIELLKNKNKTINYIFDYILKDSKS